MILNVVNIQTSKCSFIRIEFESNGDLQLTDVIHNESNTDFTYGTTLRIPKQQRNNMSEILKTNE